MKASFRIVRHTYDTWVRNICGPYLGFHITNYWMTNSLFASFAHISRTTRPCEDALRMCLYTVYVDQFQRRQFNWRIFMQIHTITHLSKLKYYVRGRVTKNETHQITSSDNVSVDRGTHVTVVHVHCLRSQLLMKNKFANCWLIIHCMPNKGIAHVCF